MKKTQNKHINNFFICSGFTVYFVFFSYLADHKRYKGSQGSEDAEFCLVFFLRSTTPPPAQWFLTFTNTLNPYVVFQAFIEPIFAQYSRK